MGKQRQSTITRNGDENTYRSAYKYHKSSSSEGCRYRRLLNSVASSTPFLTLFRPGDELSLHHFNYILPSFGRWKNFPRFPTLEVLGASNFAWWICPWTAIALNLKLWEFNLQSSEKLKGKMKQTSFYAALLGGWMQRATWSSEENWTNVKEKKAQSLKGKLFSILLESIFLLWAWLFCEFSFSTLFFSFLWAAFFVD